MKAFKAYIPPLGSQLPLCIPPSWKTPYYCSIPSMIFNSKGYPSTSSFSILPPSGSNTSDCDSSESNTSETQSSSNPEPYSLTTESITNSLISSSKHHRLASNQNLPHLNPFSIAELPIPVSSNSEILSPCSSVIPLASSFIDNMPHLNQESNYTPFVNLPTSSLATSTSLYPISSYSNKSGNLITPVVINNNDNPVPSSSFIHPQNNPTPIDSQLSTQTFSITPSHQDSSNQNPSTFN
ncbi:hypothetical protein O181_031151 [Austropuccinia psidii MF-1]|uniref:Uncharacterized protein n=1 Tax=Austropuccinia psidii MF-1 TaxID=1389203 RepID=A0A9Q3CZX0_9BASI|nr:hypothetical protein [Austropuccinia psidii MF-1]